MKKSLLVCLTFVIVVVIKLTFASSVEAASMSLSPATLTRAINEEFNVDIVVDPEGEESSGATAIIDYDKAKLQAVSVTAGTDYSEELENSIDPVAGQIRFDAGVLGSTVSQRTTLATIKFKGIAAGTAQVNIVFDPNSTTDTSIVAAADNPVNLLDTGKVNNGSYTITSSTSGGGTGGGTLPGTGALEDTLIILVGGGLLLGVGGVLARKAIFI